MRPPLEEVEGAADEASKMEEVATWRKNDETPMLLLTFPIL